MEHAPQVVEFYNKFVVRNPKVDMVLFSQDKNAEGLSKLLSAYPVPSASPEATKSRQKIPTVFRHVDRKMGWFTLVDREGKVIIEGDSDHKKIQAFIESGHKVAE